MIRVPKRLAMMLIGMGGIFGMRTPPEPTVTAQVSRPPDDAAAGPPFHHRAEGRPGTVRDDEEQ
jgi:hypothetical protein